MIVVAHGDVAEFCERHGFTIGSVYTGELEDYRGDGLVVVTDNCANEQEFYYMKLVFLRRRITLISTHWENEDLNSFVRYLKNHDTRSKTGGRLPFGYTRIGDIPVLTPAGREVALRIIALREAGAKYSDIQKDDGVHHLDGRRMSVSTIQEILKNRNRYE